MHIVDKLEVYPTVYPVPVEVVNYNILLHDALVVAAPGDENRVIAAPFTEALERILKAVTEGEALLVKAGELLDLVVHTTEVHWLYVNSKLLRRTHIFVKLDGADLYDLTAELNGELVKYGGLGTHSLIPFQIHHNVIHTFNYLHSLAFV